MDFFIFRFDIPCFFGGFLLHFSVKRDLTYDMTFADIYFNKVVHKHVLVFQINTFMNCPNVFKVHLACIDFQIFSYSMICVLRIIMVFRWGHSRSRASPFYLKIKTQEFFNWSFL